MKKIIVIILLCLCGVVFAQKTTETKKKQKPFVPGFLGKRFSLSATGNGMLTFGQANSYDNPAPSYVGFTYKAGLNGSYAITENSTIGFFFTFNNTACGYWSPTISIDSNYYGNANLNIFQFGATYKYFFGNNVAPVGPYMGIKGGLTIFNGNIMDRKKNPYFTDNYVDLNFYVSLGRQHVIKKVLLLDYGVEVGGTGIIHFLDDKTGMEPVWAYDTHGNAYNFYYGSKALLINSFQLYVGLGVVF